VNLHLGAGLDLTELVQLCLNMADVLFILFVGLWLEIHFGFTSGLGLSLSISLGRVPGMKGLKNDKKNRHISV
jgi:hypothetical protein